ncbi:YfiR family protein [Candidatus Venteria ishoeyi]|uniref:DUF4154 domain-containing protein n=1 Tax=Candidatus Venteria ishoeyi TaxID=1899563 RepID=A0A1H6FH10_9GAMM|nr:YfiR family protein [Candidatus Venteria ishoeyi]SEH08943.1 Uncharacterised protein [Candidatus Venteria ishoeyi]
MRYEIAGLLLLMLSFTGNLSAGDKPKKSAEIKAAFIINFAKFTRWPVNTTTNMVICFPTVAEPVGAVMTRKYAQVAIQNQKLKVHRGVVLNELHYCRIVYLGHHDAYRRNEILAQLSNTAVLTISDLPGFNHSGGMIELFREGNKYRFSVNLDAIAWEGLEINARILGLARNRVQ